MQGCSILFPRAHSPCSTQNEAARIPPLFSSCPHPAHSHHNTQTKQREFHRCLCRSHTPSLFALQHSDEDGDNPTAVFIVPTYSRKPVTLAVQSSVIPTALLLHPLPTHSLQRLRLRPTPRGVIPSTLVTAHMLYYPAATILQLVQDATTASSVQMSIDIFRLIHSICPEL